MKFTYPRAIALVRRGMINVGALITHHFPLEQADQAFRLVEGYQDGVVKAAVHP